MLENIDNTIESNQSLLEFNRHFNRSWYYCNPHLNPHYELQVKSFAGLYKANLDCLANIFSSEDLEVILSGKFDSIKALNFSDKLAFNLYGHELYGFIDKADFDSADKLIQTWEMNQSEGSKERFGDLPLNEIGVVVVRPEVYHIWNLVESMLNAQGLDIILSKDTSVDLQKYSIMYKHGLLHPDSKAHFPTRAIGYINKPLRLIVVKNRKQRFQSVSQFLNTNLKGGGGTYRPNTLRGDIVLKELLLIRMNQEKELRMIFDPLLIYHKIADGEIENISIFRNTTYPMLSYISGVHIPEDFELKRDLSLLCDPIDIEKIKSLL